MPLWSKTTFIANIVHKIYCELDLKLLSTPSDLTGIETRAEGINSWLESEQPGSTVLSICGMGGGGKTTLAKYIYNSNRQKFESANFLDEIENKPSVLLGLQKQLLRDILGNNIMISNLSQGTFQIERAIQRKKVLSVVDDIDDPDILDTLLGTKVFHTQSKIVITTRQPCEKITKREEVIGGDLSGFEVTEGGYYLCRRYFDISNIPDCFFDNSIQITDPQRWRTRVELPTNYEELNDIRNPDRHNYEVELGVSFNSESETDKIEKTVSSVEGVESVSINKEARRLIVCGRFDFQEVVTCVRRFEKMVQVFTYYLLPAQESDDEFFDFSEHMLDDEPEGRLED